MYLVITDEGSAYVFLADTLEHAKEIAKEHTRLIVDNVEFLRIEGPCVAIGADVVFHRF